jgi:pimeloyl-ACP methyl ester carboxylesterase
MPYVQAHGVQFHYEEHGSGRPLVIAHGLFGSIDTARAQGHSVESWGASGVRAIGIDARGHGRSGHTRRREDYGWPALASDLAAVLDALGLERVNIYGTSMGAGAALMFALAHPDRVERLVLRSPPPLGADMRALRPRMGALALLYRCLGARLTAGLIGATSPAGDPFPAMLRSQRSSAIVPAIRALAFGEPQLPLDRFVEIGAPTLVLAHPGDIQHPLRSGEVLLERLPNATLLVAPSVAHFREHRAALQRIVTAFIKVEPLPGDAFVCELRPGARSGHPAPRTGDAVAS